MSKRKWDQPATDSESPTKFAKTEDGSKSATDAASAAAAIAAKIAAQFASPAYQASSNAGSAPSGIAGPGGSATFSAEERERRKDPHDAEFTHDIEINDVRNRYLLTKGATQQEIHQLTSASVTTKGVWYPDKSKATEKDPPLYLHISATTKEILDKAIAKVNELIAIDMGSLVEDRKRDDRTRERRKWPEEKVYVNLEMLRNFNVRAKVVGPAGMFVKHIQQETGTRVQIKGQGSGFYESETGKESDDPMHIHITGPDEAQIARATELANDLLLVVRGEHTKAKGLIQGQQQELHAAQAQYATYNYGGYAAPQPSSQPPPPPSAPPPAPGDTTSADGSAGGQDAYAAYWAAYGYDVNSPEFKQWQQQQYAQYYTQQAQAGTQAGYAGAGAAAPQPSGAAPEPADAPPPPPPDSAPPPPPS